MAREGEEKAGYSKAEPFAPGFYPPVELNGAVAKWSYIVSEL